MPAAAQVSSPTPPFVAHCLELLAVLGPVRARRMFGGWGLYAQEMFVALIAFDRLYLKTDATTRARFEATGGEAFVYDAHGKTPTMTMAYWTVPDDAMDAPPLFEPWARLALQAAVAARALKPAPRPKRPPKAKPASPRRAPPAKAR